MSTNESAERKQQEEARERAVGLGMIVYTGGIVAATAIFIFFILTAFPETAYFIRFLMIVAALCVGASALAFRYALENWAVFGSHRKAAIGFYYGEIFLVGLNTIVSFSALLYTFAGNALPAWVQWYEPFTIITIAYVILAWGTLFVLDPKAQSKAKQLQVLIDFDNQVIDGMRDYLGSEDGLLAIQENANERIRQNFAVKNRAPQPWINRGNQSGPVTPGIPQAPQALPAPSPLPPRGASVPPARKTWTLDELLAFMGLDRAGAREIIRQYGLFDASSAFSALSASGYIPDDLRTPAGMNDFMYLYCELAGVAPTWGSIPEAWNPGIIPGQGPKLPARNGAGKSF